MEHYRNLVGGRLCEAVSGQILESVDPSTGVPWATIPASADADVDAAVAAADEAFWSRWRPLPAMQRARWIRRLAQVVEQHADELARLESTDNGKPFSESGPGDLPACAEMLYFHAGAADKIHGETVEVGANSVNFTRREPFGVVALIIPWNAPLALLSAKLGAALAAGNAVVVKPAEQASCSVLRLAELVAEAGFPDGVVNVVAGLGETAGDALVRHPGIGRISFTGSTETARRISERAAGALTPLHFELGGKSANLVFADADLDAATAGVTTASVYTGTAGQTCIAGSRILIERPVFDEMLERIADVAAKVRLGGPFDPATTMGPVVSAEQLDRVRHYLDLGPKEGATVVFGGRSGAELFEPGSPLAGGYYVEPTLMTTDDNGLRVCQEEIFGPVAVAIPFDRDDQVVSIANDSSYGLAAGVWTRDLARAHRMVRDLWAGSVWVNTYRRVHWALPFGGFKDSGYGRDSGLESILENTQLKTAWIDLS